MKTSLDAHVVVRRHDEMRQLRLFGSGVAAVSAAYSPHDAIRPEVREQVELRLARAARRAGR